MGRRRTSNDALVVLVYNVQDGSYYDCAETTYTAGYFAPDFLTSLGMNVIVIDPFDWANRIGAQTGNEDGVPFLMEGVIAHELEHLLMEYSDTTRCRGSTRDSPTWRSSSTATRPAARTSPTSRSSTARPR